jgi:endonuclease G
MGIDWEDTMAHLGKTFTPLSWEKLDPTYENRKGYDPDFLTLRVPVPKLGRKLKAEATLGPLAYEHFSVLLHPRRRLAFWTAVNIDGAQERRLGDRAADTWWLDKRDDKAFTPYQVTNRFYSNSGFERGHLVRRLDPAWGADETEAARGEADSFHFTNCAPQVPLLNKQWWAQVENHVLGTANATNRRISVLSGCLFTADDPLHKGVNIPLAYWKVVAWTVDTTQAGLRSLAFFVKQDEAVANLLKAKDVQPLAVALDDVPQAIQGYQTTVAELAGQTGMSFGALANPTVDVYARKRAARLAPLAFDVVDVYRRLRRPSDLLTA